MAYEDIILKEEEPIKFHLLQCPFCGDLMFKHKGDDFYMCKNPNCNATLEEEEIE